MFAKYTPSGRFSPVFIVLLFVGLIPVVIAAFVYQLGLHWIPFIYANFLLTVGAGFATGFVASFVVKLGKVRNVLIALSCAVLLSATCLGAKYAFQYSRAASERAQFFKNFSVDQLMGNEEFSSMELTAEQKQAATEEIRNAEIPYSFMEHIQERVAQGWIIGRGNGLPITGLFVYSVWLIEAGTIVGFAIFLANSAVREPFSEKLNLWADQSEVVMYLPINDAEMVAKIQTAQSVEELLEIPIPKSDLSSQFAVYTVNSIPGQEMEDAYLSVELQTHSVNKKGENEVSKQTLVEHAILTSAQRKQLQENASLLAEAIAAFQASRANPRPSPPTAEA